MITTLVFIAIVLVGMVAVVYVVGLPEARRARLVGVPAALLRDCAVAAVAVLTTALMYLAEDLAGSAVGRAVGDGSMVLAAGMLWTALSAVNGRGRARLLIASSASATLTLVSSLIPESASTPVKLVLVAGACIALGVEASIGRLRRSSVSGVFVAVGFGFGGYCLARVVVIGTLGVDSFVYERIFDTLVSAIVSGFAVIASGVGVGILYGQLTARPFQSTEPAMALSIALQVLSYGRTVRIYWMKVPDVGLVRAAHGSGAVDTIRDALVEAATTCLPGEIFALSPDSESLVIVKAERFGAASQTGELARAFEQAMHRAGFPDLTDVDTSRQSITDPEELRASLAPVLLHRPQRALA